MRLDRYNQIGEAYQSGIKLAELCKRFDCHPSDIYRAIDRLGIPRRNEKSPGGQSEA